MKFKTRLGVSFCTIIIIPLILSTALIFGMVKYQLHAIDETYGIIVFQEQIMLIARQFAGYTLGQADILRRAISKKKQELIKSEREKFIINSIKN